MGHVPANTNDLLGFTELDYVEEFLRSWGPVQWSSAVAESKISPDLRNLIEAVAMVEANTVVEARKAQTAGLFKHHDLATFFPIWEAEEGEHARALKYLLSHDTNAAAHERIKSRGEHLRHRLSPLVLFCSRALPGVDLAFCALAAAAEYVTIVTYGDVSKRSESPQHKRLFLDIARQEGRHMRFYLAAAKARSHAYGRCAHIVARLILRYLWRPVGVNPLGAAGWQQAFAPLLQDPGFVVRVLKMDSVIDSVPGLEGLRLMQTYLNGLPKGQRRTN